MPQLKDCVSSFKIDPAVTHQESYTTTILKWMQDNPAQTKRTTAARMARTMALGGVTKQSEKHIRMTIHNMCSRGMLSTVGGQGRAKKTFFINYLHKTMPKEVIDRAPEADIRRHEKLAGVQLREEVKKEPAVEEPMVETESVEPTPVPPVAPVQAPAMNVPIELEKMPNGNFTLQLNINFTINSKS